MILTQEQIFDEPQEFCLNSNRWIAFMFLPPDSCPHKEEKLWHCERCTYYEKREVTYYFKKKYQFFRNIK